MRKSSNAGKNLHKITIEDDLIIHVRNINRIQLGKGFWILNVYYIAYYSEHTNVLYYLESRLTYKFVITTLCHIDTHHVT